MFKKIQWTFSVYFLNSLLIQCPHSINVCFMAGPLGTIVKAIRIGLSQTDMA